MKAAVLQAPNQLEMMDVETPKPAEDELLIEMKAAGICGSDVHFYRGTDPYAKFPQVLGHELCGVVAKAGSASSKFKAGDHVVIEPTIPCGHCFQCRIGKSNCCSNMDMLGVIRPGGFADFVIVPELLLHLIPNDMSFEVGAICEPFAIGAQVISRADIKKGYSVTIVGVGPIGMAVLILLKANYSNSVTVIDISAERLEMARSFGADATINAIEHNPLEAIVSMTGGEGSNIVIECAGTKGTIELVMNMVSPGGRVVIVGITKDSIEIPAVQLTRKEMEIYGSRNQVNKFPEIIAFLNQNPDLANRYISRIMKFADIQTSMDHLIAHSNSINKMVLTY